MNYTQQIEAKLRAKLLEISIQNANSLKAEMMEFQNTSLENFKENLTQFLRGVFTEQEKAFATVLTKVNEAAIERVDKLENRIADLEDRLGQIELEKITK